MAYLRPTSYHNVMLRPIQDTDNEPLFRIFIASHNDLIVVAENLNETQQDTFLRIQFQAQQEQYCSNYPDARFEVILTDNKVIGNIYVAPINQELRLVDVNLLPEFRNRGIGHALVKDLLDEATHLDKCVTLHVQLGNPAIHLYERLGLIKTGQQGIYKRMEWLPSSESITRRTVVN